jgi:pimeloyl-ACP methyl ester carboxylesterase
MPRVQRNGVQVHYESFGSGAAIVLLHPASTNRYFWAHQIFAFARGHRVIVLDHRGHGLSDRPAQGYAITEMAADLVAVLDDARVDRAVLVGDSMGGMIAVQAALDAPHRVRGLVIVSSATNLAPRVPPPVLTAYVERFEAAFGFMLQGATSARTKRERPEVCAFLADVQRVEDTRAVFLSCLVDPGGVFHWNVEGRLAEIRLPALVIAGQEDQAVPLDATRQLSAGIPGAALRIVPAVGHFYPMERPADFNDDLRAFLHWVEMSPQA